MSGPAPATLRSHPPLVVLNGATSFLADGQGDAWVTHDDGVTWASAAIPNHSTVYTADFLTFADAQHGWAYTWGGGVWATSDGGASWVPQTIIGPAHAPIV